MADVLGFVKKVLPWIGSAAAAVATGGPAGLIGVAVKGIGQIVGKDVAPTADSLAAAVAGATPDQIIQMKKLDDDFKAQMQQMGFQHEEEIEKLLVQDRDSARNREIQTKDRTPKILAFVVCVLCFGGEAAYFFHGARVGTSPELVGRILGTLDSALMLVLSYYFGSSHGSDQKNAVIAEAVHNASQ